MTEYRVFRVPVDCLVHQVLQDPRRHVYSMDLLDSQDRKGSKAHPVLWDLLESQVLQERRGRRAKSELAYQVHLVRQATCIQCLETAT